VAQEIMERCKARLMLVSDWGLREGIVFDLYEKHRGAETR
jgi:exopolyphosphatase/pppGpp-phosphohydrolase